MRFLLDTNVLSEPLKARPNERIVRHLALHEGHAAMAAVSWHELRFGVERMPAGKRRDAFREAIVRLRAHYPVFDYDAASADWHARERARLEAKGRHAEYADGQIAAIAATQQLTLVTANARDFRHYQGVAVVDWSR